MNSSAYYLGYVLELFVGYVLEYQKRLKENEEVGGVPGLKEGILEGYTL